MADKKASLWRLHPKRIDIFLLIIASIALLFLGLHEPVLTVRKLWEKNTFTIITGIENLWKENYHFLAIIVFFFSIIFPFTKLAALLLIWFVKMTERQRKWILSCLEFLGKWSMLDVFVVAIVIVSVKLGALASAKAEVGIYYFGASILLAMVATGLQNSLVKQTK